MMMMLVLLLLLMMMMLNLMLNDGAETCIWPDPTSPAHVSRMTLIASNSLK